MLTRFDHISNTFAFRHLGLPVLVTLVLQVSLCPLLLVHSTEAPLGRWLLQTLEGIRQLGLEVVDLWLGLRQIWTFLASSGAYGVLSMTLCLVSGIKQRLEERTYTETLPGSI